MTLIQNKNEKGGEQATPAANKGGSVRLVPMKLERIVDDEHKLSKNQQENHNPKVTLYENHHAITHNRPQSALTIPNSSSSLFRNSKKLKNKGPTSLTEHLDEAMESQFGNASIQTISSGLANDMDTNPLNKSSSSYFNEFTNLNESQKHNDDLIEQIRKQIELFGRQMEIFVGRNDIKGIHDLMDKMENLSKINGVFFSRLYKYFSRCRF